MKSNYSELIGMINTHNLTPGIEDIDAYIDRHGLDAGIEAINWKQAGIAGIIGALVTALIALILGRGGSGGIDKSVSSATASIDSALAKHTLAYGEGRPSAVNSSATISKETKSKTDRSSTKRKLAEATNASSERLGTTDPSKILKSAEVVTAVGEILKKTDSSVKPAPTAQEIASPKFDPVSLIDVERYKYLMFGALVDNKANNKRMYDLSKKITSAFSSYVSYMNNLLDLHEKNIEEHFTLSADQIRNDGMFSYQGGKMNTEDHLKISAPFTKENAVLWEDANKLASGIAQLVGYEISTLPNSTAEDSGPHRSAKMYQNLGRNDDPMDLFKDPINVRSFLSNSAAFLSYIDVRIIKEAVKQIEAMRPRYDRLSVRASEAKGMRYVTMINKTENPLIDGFKHILHASRVLDRTIDTIKSAADVIGRASDAKLFVTLLKVESGLEDIMSSLYSTPDDTESYGQLVDLVDRHALVPGIESFDLYVTHVGLDAGIEAINWKKVGAVGIIGTIIAIILAMIGRGRAASSGIPDKCDQIKKNIDKANVLQNEIAEAMSGSFVDVPPRQHKQQVTQAQNDIERTIKPSPIKVKNPEVDRIENNLAEYKSHLAGLESNRIAKCKENIINGWLRPYNRATDVIALFDADELYKRSQAGGKGSFSIDWWERIDWNHAPKSKPWLQSPILRNPGKFNEDLSNLREACHDLSSLTNKLDITIVYHSSHLDIALGQIQRFKNDTEKASSIYQEMIDDRTVQIKERRRDSILSELNKLINIIGGKNINISDIGDDASSQLHSSIISTLSDSIVKDYVYKYFPYKNSEDGQDYSPHNQDKITGSHLKKYFDDVEYDYLRDAKIMGERLGDTEKKLSKVKGGNKLDQYEKNYKLFLEASAKSTSHAAEILKIVKSDYIFIKFCLDVVRIISTRFSQIQTYCFEFASGLVSLSSDIKSFNSNVADLTNAYKTEAEWRQKIIDLQSDLDKVKDAGNEDYISPYTWSVHPNKIIPLAPGNENLEYQGDSLLNDIAMIIGTLRKNNKFHKRGFVDSKLSKIIHSRTGISTKFVITNTSSPYAAVEPPYINPNHAFYQTELRPLFRRHYDKGFKKLDGEKYGTVNVKTSKVTGWYSELTCPVYLSGIDTWTGFSDRGIAGIILHEVGHIFYYFYCLNKRIFDLSILSRTIQEVSGVKDAYKRRDVIIYGLNKLEIDVVDPDTLLDPKYQGKQVDGLIMALYVDGTTKSNEELKDKEYTRRSFEQLADHFASMHGASKDMAEAIYELHRRHDDQYTTDPASFYLTEAMKVMITGLFPFIIPFVLLSMFMIHDREVYDDLPKRVALMRKNLIGEIKNHYNNQKMIERIKEDVEFIKQIEASITNRKTIYDLIQNVIVPRSIRLNAQERKYTVIEDIIHNDIFISAIQTK